MSVPCVSTDICDAASIVANTGIIVAPCNPTALADALESMIGKNTDERWRLGKLARLRIEKEFSIETATKRYEDAY